MKLGIVVQARLGSTRFPGKVLARIHGRTLVEIIHRRLSRSKHAQSVIFAIPDGGKDDVLAQALEGYGFTLLRGPEKDVQSRFLKVAEAFGLTHLVRITGDCPLVDPGLVDSVAQVLSESGCDYVSNVHPPTFPDGLDVEAFSLDALRRLRSEFDTPMNREHVTFDFSRVGGFHVENIVNPVDLSSMRWTVDYPEDLQLLSRSLPSNFESLAWDELLTQGLDKLKVDSDLRNKGAHMGQGQKLWERAKHVIPGGGMLLSKRSEMFLPEQWPAYYSKSKGITVWDLDGREYKDFSMMSVGACSLGYSDPCVNEAVSRAVSDGVMSSLNSPAEVSLAERLLDLNPWAGMVRFARSGGEANSIAVRIGRASSGRDKVAICGYHGWHDWYLAANLASDKNLDGHLLPGLEPTGVPRALVDTTVPFQYNDADSLETLLKTGEFGVVKMEVSRTSGPAEGFLQKVRELCDQYGAILIFDECTSGFRETFGGLHLRYEVEPDIAMFGKALGNGFAITAVVGRTHVMKAASESFISSTFWTERIGPVAALATLEQMERLESWKILPEVGRSVKNIWSRVLMKHGLMHSISGLDALASFSLDYENWPILRTLFIQEMLDRGILANSSFYASAAHTPDSLVEYEAAFDEVARVIANSLEGEDAGMRLRGPIAFTGFKRLN